MNEMVMKQENSEFSLVTPRMIMKTMFICQPDLANVVRLTSNFLSKNTW
jgi:hypothetical protein